MKKLRLLPLILIAAVLHCSEIPTVSAQDAAQAVAENSLPLEKVAERIKQIDDDFKKQVGTFVAVVDAEVAAKRISDIVAQLLRELAQAPQFNFNELSMNIPQKSGAMPVEQPEPGAGSQGTRNNPQKNEAIYAAAKDLDAASKLQQIRFNTVVSDLSKVLRLRLNDTVLGKPKPEEIATLIQTLERIQGRMQRRMLNTVEGHVSSENLIAILNAIKQLAEAEKDRSTIAFSTAITAFRISARNVNLFKSDEISNIITRYLEPIRKATEEQGASIEAMIEARKPAQEITTAVETYAQAIRQFNSLPSDGDYNATGTRISEAVPDFYRIVIAALKSLENGEYDQADQYLKRVAEMERQLAPSSFSDRKKSIADSETRVQIVGKIQKELSEKVTKLREQASADIISRISAVKEAADITALMSEIEKRSRQSRMNSDGSNNDDLARLIEPLRDLNRAWVTNNPQTIVRLDQQFAMTQREPPAAFRKEITALRNRILRIIFATTFNAPELNAAPYNDKEPEVGIEAFCDDLMQRGDWRRLLEILQLRTPAAAQRAGQREDEAIPAIRSYLAGKNCELAEQWADAVLAYKVVLRSSAKRAPIQAASESIKVITKAHPKAITEAAIREKNDTKVSPPVTPLKSPQRDPLPLGQHIEGINSHPTLSQK